MKGFKKLVAVLMAVLMTVAAAGCAPVSLLGTIGAAVGAGTYVIQNADELGKQEAQSVVEESSEEENAAEENSEAAESSQEEEPVEEVENAEFNEFLKDLFAQVIGQDYTAVHVFLLNPEAYGIDLASVEKSYGSAPTEESMEEDRQITAAQLKQLKSFDYESLSKAQKAYYDELLYQLELDQAMHAEKFDYYANSFSQMNGIHYSLASLMGDWVLRNEQDAVDLIELLNTTRTFVDQHLDYTREQQSRGLMSISVEDVNDYCWKILNEGMDSAILKQLLTQVDGLGLSDEIAESYRSQISDAFENNFLPAYRDIVDVLTELDQNGENYKRGLWAFPDGKEYYSLVLQSNLGSSISVEEMLTTLDKKAEAAYNQLVIAMQKNPEALSVIFDASVLPFTNYEEILEVVYSKMSADFPEIGEVAYTISNMDEELASDSGVAAYYNLPPVDGDEVNVMKVNPNGADLSTLSTYETVVHEGLPGHMYMFNYLKKNNIPELFYCCGQLAYTEGWSVYSSYLAMDYLDLDAGVADVLVAYNEFVYYCLLQLDIGIHYQEWEFSDFIENGAEMGLLDEDDEEGNWAQYLQLQNDPTVFFAYYGGYMQFDDLMTKAKDALGKKFDLCAFNEALLQYGPVNFEIVERSVDEYIAANK